MKNDTILKMEGFTKAELTIQPEAKKMRADLLAKSVPIKSIQDPFAADDAREVLKGISDLAKTVEDARKAIKAPVTKLGREIDTTAKDFLKALEAEKSRLSKVVGAFELEERKRIEKEEAEAKQKALEAEMKAEARESKAETPEEHEAAYDQSIAEIGATKERLAVVQAAKKGRGRLREELIVEVTDIHALYKAAPELVKLEPNLAAIKTAIKCGRILPGVVSRSEAALSV